MSSNNKSSLAAALEARSSPVDKIYLSAQMVREVNRTGENVFVTSMEDNMSAKVGFTFMHLDDKLRRQLPKFNHIDQNQWTVNILFNELINLGEGVYGVNRYEVDGQEKLRNLWGDDRYSIGDFPLEDICKTKKSFFQMHNIPSVTDEMGMVPLGGVSYLTCQLSCGKSQLGDLIEHSGAGSLNIFYDWAVKEWTIYSPSDYVSAIGQMSEIQSTLCLGDFTGVCDDTLTHRDTRFDPPVKNCTSTIVLQEPGDILIVHPSAIHNVRNHGTNIAESRNFLPAEYKNLLATYKVCKHSEFLQGNPLLKYTGEITEKMHTKDFIHVSDPKKEYKLRLINLVEETVSLAQYKQKVREEIQQYHNVSSLMELLLPFENEVENSKKEELKKKFPCDYCEYSTMNHSDLKKHVKRIHPGKKCFKNSIMDVCSFCSGQYKQLRQHKQKCKDRS